MDLHEELERRISRFKRREAALFFMSGFAGNAGLIPQLAGEGDAILTDELNHGSIIDGVRLTKAQRVIYRHRDVGDLERALKEVDGWAKKILVITDGVFSMDGDIAPVGDIARVGEEFGAMIYVDDAHGEGVLGDGGRGVASHFHVEDKIQIELGTFSKALGVVGGYVAGSNDLRNYALNKSRTWLLSGSHPPAVAAACTAAIDVLEPGPQPEHRERRLAARGPRRGARRLRENREGTESPHLDAFAKFLSRIQDRQDFVSEGPEERLGRSVLRLDQCREHLESLLTKDA